MVGPEDGESRLAPQTMPSRGSSRLAQLKKKKTNPSHFRGERRRRYSLSAALCGVCVEMRVFLPPGLLLSALRSHTHSHLVQPQHHGSCALPLVVTSQAALSEMLNTQLAY